MSFSTYCVVSGALMVGCILQAIAASDSAFSAIQRLCHDRLSVLAAVNIQCVCILVCTSALIRWCVGPLRDIEIERLKEWGKSFVTNTGVFLLLHCAVTDAMQAPLWVLRCVLLIGCMRALHLIAEIRCTYLFELGVPKGAVCAKIISLTSLMAAADVLGLHVFGAEVLAQSHAGCLDLWVCFELGMMLTSATITAVSYTALMIDSARAVYGRERNETLTLALDLASCGARVLVHLLFLSVLAVRIVIPERLPVYVVADLVPLVSHAAARLRGLQRSSSAMVAASTFRTATSREVASTGTCIVCRDDFSGQPDISIVRLSCGHVFHRQCLTSWFRVQQVCPTCRQDVLEHKPEEAHVSTVTGDDSDSDCSASEVSEGSVDYHGVNCNVTPPAESSWTEMDSPADEMCVTAAKAEHEGNAVMPAHLQESAVSAQSCRTQEADPDGCRGPPELLDSEEKSAGAPAPQCACHCSPVAPPEISPPGRTSDKSDALKKLGVDNIEWQGQDPKIGLGSLVSQMQDSLAMATWMTECARIHSMR
mmetsp:Transcript_23916/g.58014  ORF Transcript_23916/g.58014 Transcript_23916/m.58014 type:complete len:537 (-) Transcript_23916:24-1634(-)